MPAKRAQAQKKSESFEEVARRLGCDENEAAFEEKLKKVAKQRPAPKTKKG
jgi:hypothetical protein